MVRLDGRTALIAGASAGIGAHFATALAAAGANVVLGARRLAKVQGLAEAIGPAALAVELDVSDEASVIAAYDAAQARFGTVNAVVANAGVGTGGRSTDIAVSGLRSVLDTNLLGAYLVAREGAKRMIAAGSRDTGEGRVVLIGSTTALRAGMGDTLYAATKAGVEHMGRNLARE
ncbi:MAG TPA: SDR family oxidoreductase, partial [Novosphingobium sp.]|nr:SDR family oxidoreductase [Novosphingobium sp.]